MNDPAAIGSAMIRLMEYMKDEPDGGGISIESFKRGGLTIEVREIHPSQPLWRSAKIGVPSVDKFVDHVDQLLSRLHATKWEPL